MSRRSPIMTRVPPTLLLLAFTAALVPALSGCQQAQASALPSPAVPDNEVWLSPEQMAQVRLEAVKVQAIADQLPLGGRVAFDDLRISHVFSPVAGRVTRVLAQPGDRVKQGAALATLTSPDVGSTFSDLVKAQADMEAADLEAKRQRELFEAHAGPQKDLEAAENALKKARAELSRAEQKAKLLRAGGADAVTQELALRAPIDGEVISRAVNPGMEVQGQYGGGNAVELFTVGELDEVLVMADLHEMELPQVHVGDPVRVSVVAYPGRTFEGRVEWISSALDPQLHTARIRCRIKNPDSLLKPEMYATVSVEVRRPEAVALRRSGLVRLGAQTMAMVSLGVAPDGRRRFERRPVQVDEDVSGDFYPVQRGLKEGEVVVVDGALLLSQES